MTDEWTTISAYTRAQAIADGVLVDVSTMAMGSAGFTFPVAVTGAVWSRYVEDPHKIPGQDENGRLWDILHMLRVAIKGANDGSEIRFKLYVAMPDAGDWQSNEDVPERNGGLTRESHRLVSLKALCGPGDNGEPVITIMLPGED